MAIPFLAGALSVGVVPGPAAAPAASAQEAAQRPDVGYVGDSLGVRSEYQLRATFRHRRPFNVLAITDGAYVDWVRRRWVDRILQDPPSILIVGLGHGDGTHSTPPHEFATQVRAFLDEVVPHVDCVRWLDVRERWMYFRNVTARAAAYNRVLRRQAARYRKVEVVYWSDWADQAPDRYFEADRLHPSRPGRWVLARMASDAADGCDPNLRTGPYWDVLDHQPHAPAVRWLRRNGIIRDDHGNGTFQARLGHLPQPVVRSELIRWLWRREGRPPPAAPAPWPDVPPALARPAAWAAERELLRPLGDGRFRAERPVRRGELLGALWTLAGSPPSEDPSPWPDVPTRLHDAAVWARSTGVLDVGPDGRFHPTRPATRAVAAMAVAPQDLAAPAPRPEPGGPWPPPRRLRGDPPRGDFWARSRGSATDGVGHDGLEAAGEGLEAEVPRPLDGPG